MTGHPSEYALDRAALGGATPDVAAHVARCTRCSDAIAARRASVEPPPWLASVKVGPERRPRRRWWWLLPLPIVAATALALLTVQGGTMRSHSSLDPRPDRSGGEGQGEGADWRAKGGPSVLVFVKRGDAVTPWDGRSAIRPGDRLQLSVRGAGYAQLSVASVSPSPGAPAVLWAGPLAPDGDTVPPLSFRVDGQGSREVLSVILSARPIAPWQHGAARGLEGAWSTRIEIPKEDAR